VIPQEVLNQIKRIHIRTRRIVNDQLVGQYESVFKGQGMEFKEVREYQPGDEIRSIDWNVTARTGKPFVKVFAEERETTVMLMVDVSASGLFGTRNRIKNELAAELCAVLAFSAIKNNDRVGLIMFTDEVEKFVPPKKGRPHVLRVIREVLYHEPYRSGTDIGSALRYLDRVTTRRSVVFLVSDFMTEGYEQMLRIANKRHDVIAVKVTDPREETLPDVGLIRLEDAETGETMLVDTSDESVRRGYAGESARRRDMLRKTMRSMGLDSIDVRTDRPYVEPLIRFFRLRERRMA
jgi:uncharacterized protein (DUF58 family)